MATNTQLILKSLLIFLSFITSLDAKGQEKISTLEIQGPSLLVLSATQDSLYTSGKLSTGEVIKIGCSGGACYFKIEYKGRIIEETIGDDITDLQVFEYDFGNDGDKELVVRNDFMGTSFLYVFAYGRGLIEKLFEKEILYYKTIIKQNYIELYLPSGLGNIWNFYQGNFWEMSPLIYKK